MRRLSATLRLWIAAAALLLQLSGAWLHAFSHEDHGDASVHACEDARDGHWHPASGDGHGAQHACVQCQRVSFHAAAPAAVHSANLRDCGIESGPAGPLELHPFYYLPSAPRRGPPTT